MIYIKSSHWCSELKSFSDVNLGNAQTDDRKRENLCKLNLKTPSAHHTSEKYIKAESSFTRQLWSFQGFFRTKTIRIICYEQRTYIFATHEKKKCRRDPGKINNLKTQWLFISSFTICALDTPGTLFSYIGRNEQWALFDSLSNLPMDLECCWYHTTKNQSGQSENERKSHVFIILPLYWYSWLGFNLLFTHTHTRTHTIFFAQFSVHMWNCEPDREYSDRQSPHN